MKIEASQKLKKNNNDYNHQRKKVGLKKNEYNASLLPNFTVDA